MMKATTIQKMNGIRICQWLAGILGAAVVSGSAESLSSSQAPTGERPKFRSKIHIPVKLAKEVMPLPPPGYELVFGDEFDGSAVDTTRWGFRLESKMLSAQQQENVSVKDGKLVIALRKESVRGKNYTAGGIISRQKFVYGYYEARFKTPPAEGWHTAFWAMRKNFPDQKSRLPALLELDFCEQDGGDPHYFSFGIINQSRYHQKKNRQSWNAGRWVIEDAPDTSAGFHVWACEFTPETTRFYFDGRLAKEISSAGFPHDEMNVWFSVIASTLKGDRWVDESKLPNAVFCDYIRVYQHPKYRAAEASVRAEVLRPRPPLEKKNIKPKGPKLEDLN
ncbi:MAG: glycoside hydrolase family 16 protein [Akkermansiaceae bacterium]|jgi:beta-glucanase (GH16 family)|nr:glycoside hydrolase family 16 protein [Akkermansiaceae bacterium]